MLQDDYQDYERLRDIAVKVAMGDISKVKLLQFLYENYPLAMTRYKHSKMSAKERASWNVQVIKGGKQ